MKLKKTTTFPLALGILLLAGCNDKSSETKEKVTSDTVKSATNEPQVTKTVDAKLICKDLGEDSMGNPHFDVLLSVDGRETKLKSIYACGEIPRTEYKNYDIPFDAITACGGWWAGAGDYFYIAWRGGKCTVFEGWLEEGQDEKGYHWKEMPVN